MKKKYLKLEMLPVPVELDKAILAASKTASPVGVQNVSVDDFEAGFNESGLDFKEISFD